MNSLTLSITTIGDLLLRKTITNCEEPIKDVELCVPLYQRPYKWTARNIILSLSLCFVKDKHTNPISFLITILGINNIIEQLYGIPSCPFVRTLIERHT